MWLLTCKKKSQSALPSSVAADIVSLAIDVQARRLWESVLYAQPKVRTDQGLATLAQQVCSCPPCNEDTKRGT